jgi:predicted transcriptional regulator
MTAPGPTSDRDARLRALRQAIAETVARRERLKADMTAWYAEGRRGRFPGWAELAAVDQALSDLDTRFKRAYAAAD